MPTTTKKPGKTAPKERSAAHTARIVIENIAPAVDGGRYPAKRVVGENCVVSADIFRDGHDTLTAILIWRREGETVQRTAPMTHVENDRWTGSFPLTENGRYLYTIEAWTDRYTSWLIGLKKRIAVGRQVTSEILEGAALIRAAMMRAQGHERAYLKDLATKLKKTAEMPEAALKLALDPQLVSLMAEHQAKPDATTHAPEIEVIADRRSALFSAWYEFFIRSAGTDPDRPATFRDAGARLPAIREMGFDVVYLPPIHPIGFTCRKGPNNSRNAGPEHPGSPWAIGNDAGGHTAVDPALGTLADFDHFVAKAQDLGLEIALDFAVQCSPDHPWVREHPEWFLHRPDGTIKYAENPPKKYEDIYPINFDCDNPQALWDALRDVVLFWIRRGVRIFRVDNPHTKPFRFWQWLIRRIQDQHPDVIFLAEAFTRPKVMKLLAKAGFTQSYTYFTWRTRKWELTAYMKELALTEMKDYFRPNFFANTPDILHEILQAGGPPAFKMRLVLAATLSPAYGLYSGFELCENEAVPGTEEYMNSEKYEIKVRDWNAPGNIVYFITRVNTIRRENPALQALSNIVFFETDNENILLFAKQDPGTKNTIIVAVNLDPFSAHAATGVIRLADIGLPPGSRFDVHDLITGARYNWGEHNYIRLDPLVEPAHIFRVEGAR